MLLQHLYGEVDITLKFGYLGCSQNNQVFPVLLTTFFLQCTMLQSVRGTKQYWFVRQSELRRMIREWNSPTLFLTLSCAEYESTDITTYLRKINKVSSSYDIGKLCIGL